MELELAKGLMSKKGRHYPLIIQTTCQELLNIRIVVSMHVVWRSFEIMNILLRLKILSREKEKKNSLAVVPQASYLDTFLFH